MPKFFIDQNDISDKVVLHSDNMHHIVKVLRYGIGDEITVCDGTGTDYIVQISEILKERILCEIKEILPNVNEPKVKITLFQGLPKGDKFSLIVEKCVEAGVYEIVPVALSRCVVKLSKADFEKKAERLRKISEAASKQCGRGIVPKIGSLINLKELIELRDEFDLLIFPYELEQEVSLKKKMKDFQGSKIGIIIGGEGGFDPSEVNALMKNNILPVSLGKRILRTETAGLAAIFNILYELELN